MKKIVPIILVLGLIANSFGAITQDYYSPTAYGGVVSGATYSHTCSGTNRYLLVYVLEMIIYPSASVTFNGVSVPLIAGPTYNPDNSMLLSIYGMAAPSVGTANVVVSLSDSSLLSTFATSWNGVNQTTPVEAIPSIYGQANGTPFYSSSMTLASSASDMVTDFMCSRYAPTPTQNAGQTFLTSGTTFSTINPAASSYIVGASPSQTTGWTFPSCDDSIQGAVSMIAAASAPTALPFGSAGATTGRVNGDAE